jgi:hypothetical protein
MQIVELEGGMLLCVKSMPTAVSEVFTDAATKRMVAQVSTESVDSDGDVIHQGKNKRGAGWQLDKFNASPLMTWMHDTYRPNIGAPDVQAKIGSGANGRALFLDPFAFDVGDEFAMEIAGKYARGVLKETSVGFIGRVWDWRNKDNNIVGREYFEQELVEVASVNRGANPDTKTEVKAMMARMLVKPKVIKSVDAGGDSELLALKDEISDMNEKLAILANAIKQFSDCNVPVEVVLDRAQSVASDRYVLSHDTLKRLDQVGLLQG